MNVSTASTKVRIGNFVIPLAGGLIGCVCYFGSQGRTISFSELKDVILAITPVAGLWLAAHNIRIGNELQAKARKREAAEAWLEKTFLSEGVEPIVNYLQLLLSGISEESNGSSAPEFPRSATTRMTIFFRHDRLFALLNILSEESLYYKENKDARASEGFVHLLGTIQLLNEQLLEFGTFLLYCEVDGKGDILKLNRDASVELLSKQIMILFEEHFAKEIERSHLKKQGVKEGIPEKPIFTKVGQYRMESPSRQKQKESDAVDTQGDCAEESEKEEEHFTDSQKEP